MDKPLSIAIETSCRSGGIALGAGESLLEAVDFDTTARHATELVRRMEKLLRRHELTPSDLDEVYVSAGPGSFTGLRVGVTVARTLAQAVEGLRCVSVPTHLALAYGARSLQWTHLGVVLAWKRGTFHATVFRRKGEQLEQATQSEVLSPAEFLARAPRPITLIGEATAHCDFPEGQIALAAPADSPLHLPTPTAVWQAGRDNARSGRFTDPAALLPIYPRKPEAIRLWQRRQGYDPRPDGPSPRRRTGIE